MHVERVREQDEFLARPIPHQVVESTQDETALFEMSMEFSELLHLRLFPLESHFGKKVYQTIVPRNVRLAEAPSYGKPVIAFDKNSKGAQAYTALAREILERVAP